MANIKKITHLHSLTGLTLYCIVRRDSDGYLLNDADGAFANAPTDFYIAMTEDSTIKGLYEKSESRAAWGDGYYTTIVCRQNGSSPDIASDTIVGGGDLRISSDLETDIILTTATITSIAAAIWNYLTTAMTTVGSIGKRMAEWFSYTAVASSSYGATDLVLCNNALMMCGNEAVANLTDTTKKGVRLCTQFYQQAVDEALRAYSWNCALKRVAVTVDATAPAWGYAYRYELPSDCLRVVGLDELTYNYTYKIEGGYLLTDEATCNLLYVQRITPDNMDVLLRRTVSARLASLIAFPLTNSTSLADAMFKLYKDCVQEAETVDAFEGTSEQLVNPGWIDSRS